MDSPAVVSFAPFAADALLKSTLVLALASLSLVLLRRVSAGSRHLIGLLGLLGAVAVPLLSPVVPSVRVPLLPRVFQAADVNAASVGGERPAAVQARKARPEPAPLPAAGAFRPDGVAASRAAAPAQPSAERRLDRSAVGAVPPTTPVGGTARGLGIVDSPEPSERAASPAGPASWPARVPWIPLLASVWAAGALVVFLRFAVGTGRVLGIVRRATEVRHPEWLSDTSRLARLVGVQQPFRLFHTEEVSVALAGGIFRPVLVLPEEARSWSEERRRMVLLHELAHVRRSDCLSLLLTSLATSVFWFHPLAWFVARRIRQEAEKACDDLVLEAGARPSDYAAELLAIVRSLRFTDDDALPAMALLEGSQLEGRLRAILDPSVRRRTPSAVTVATATLLLFGVASVLAAVEPWEDAEKATPKVAGVTARTKSVRSATVTMSAASSGAAVLEEAPVVVRASTRRTVQAGKATDANGPECASAPALADPESPVQPAVLRDPEVAPVLVGMPGEGVVLAGSKGGRSGSDWYSRGMSRHQDERYDAAIEAFERAIELGYREEAASYNIACGYALKGDKDRAFEWLRKAMDAGFDVEGYLDDDDDLESLRSDPRWAELRKAARSHRVEKRKGEVRSLTARLDRLLKDKDSDAGSIYEVGMGLLKAGEYRRSAEAFQVAAERGSGMANAAYNAACALSLADDKVAALDWLEKSVEQGYSDPDHMDRDDDLDNIRREPRYREIRQMAEDLDLPDGVGGVWNEWNGALKATRRKAEWREAEERYKRFLEKHPGSGRAYSNLGLVQMRLGEGAASVQSLQKAHELGYKKLATAYNIACAYAHLDQKDAAFEWLNKALDAGFGGYWHLKNDGDLDNLRDDPRFRKALSAAREREKEKYEEHEGKLKKKLEKVWERWTGDES